MVIGDVPIYIQYTFFYMDDDDDDDEAVVFVCMYTLIKRNEKKMLKKVFIFSLTNL